MRCWAFLTGRCRADEGYRGAADGGAAAFCRGCLRAPNGEAAGRRGGIGCAESGVSLLTSRQTRAMIQSARVPDTGQTAFFRAFALGCSNSFPGRMS